MFAPYCVFIMIMSLCTIALAQAIPEMKTHMPFLLTGLLVLDSLFIGMGYLFHKDQQADDCKT